MRLTRKLTHLIGVILFFVVSPLFAANLLQAYQKALVSDPTFKQAQAVWSADKENLPIAEAGYLPQFDFSANYDHMAFTRNNPVAQTININGFYRTYGMNATLTQPIFNAQAWASIKTARASVKAATATYFAAEQDLMVRLVTAYLNVLRAYDKLRFTVANKRAVYRQLETAREKFKVGLIAITGVYDAKSRYDIAVAEEINDRNELNDRVEDLRAITGVHYKVLSGSSKDIPLITPRPNNINNWVHVALMQNYSLHAQLFTEMSARDRIHQVAAGGFPVVNLVGNWTQSISTDHALSPNTNFRTATVGVQVNFPLLQGGLVVASTRQARYQYLDQVGRVEFTRREVVRLTRQAYLGVVAGISKVKADKQAILSARNALEATEAGYVVGTRTMVDVLNDLATVYDAQRVHADDQYDYILRIVELKQAAGTLSINDIVKINAWLDQKIKLPLPTEAFQTSKTHPLKHNRYRRRHRRSDAEMKKYDPNIKVIDNNNTTTPPSSIYRQIQNPTTVPGVTPSTTPSTVPSTTPSTVPSTTPSTVPSTTPSTVPSTTPSTVPSTTPSTVPSTTPSTVPSTTPSTVPSTTPSTVPSTTPSTSPSTLPSLPDGTTPGVIPPPADKTDSPQAHNKPFVRYAIQLSSERREAKAKRVLANLKINKPARLVKIGKRYRVVVGEYKSVHEAYEAMIKLPSKVAGQQAVIITLLETLPQPSASHFIAAKHKLHRAKSHHTVAKHKSHHAKSHRSVAKHKSHRAKSHHAVAKHKSHHAKSHRSVAKHKSHRAKSHHAVAKHKSHHTKPHHSVAKHKSHRAKSHHAAAKHKSHHAKSHRIVAKHKSHHSKQHRVAAKHKKSSHAASTKHALAVLHAPRVTTQLPVPQ